jgi:hypothetical protein
MKKKTILISPVFICLWFCSCYIYSQKLPEKALNIPLKSAITGKSEYIIPSNGKNSILFLGGKYSKENKLEWYDKLINNYEGIENINLIMLIQLANVPSFVPRSLAEQMVKEEMIRISNDYKQLDNLYFFFDWETDITNYYKTDIDKVSLVLVDDNNRLLNIIRDKYSTQNMNTIKNAFKNHSVL